MVNIEGGGPGPISRFFFLMWRWSTKKNAWWPIHYICDYIGHGEELDWAAIFGGDDENCIECLRCGATWDYVSTEDVLQKAQDILKDRAEAWLDKPNQALSNKIPRQLLKTSQGCYSVSIVLSRIEHGIFS
jgi:hypothetical protein